MGIIRWMQRRFAMLVGALTFNDEPCDGFDELEPESCGRCSAAEELCQRLKEHAEGSVRVARKGQVLFVQLGGLEPPPFIADGYFRGMRVIVEG